MGRTARHPLCVDASSCWASGNYDWADLYGETTGYGFELGRSYASADCQFTDLTHVEWLIGDRALKDLGARAEVRIVVQLDHQAVHERQPAGDVRRRTLRVLPPRCRS